ncbi:MAG: hypothetical protein FJ291_25290 [Planctomycetes bacterium]|nr:hypothetical protein [Planctomycetota bacterium]
MTQSVLDGVVAIEAKAAKVVDDAKERSRQAREKVKSELDSLARELDEQGKREMAQYQGEAENKKAAALASLDRRLALALAALERVRAERVAPLVEELLRLLEQRADGN